MNCPTCNITLLITDREGIEIDYCPQCRGIWLDRGELDKIIQRSAPAEKKWYQNDHDDDDHHKPEHGQSVKRKKSFLGDLLDIG
jgi:Zn-finger nucleic acid-binding protein